MNYLNIFSVAMDDTKMHEVGYKLMYSCEFDFDMKFRDVGTKVHETAGYALGDGFRGKFSSHKDVNYFDLYIFSESETFDNRYKEVVSGLKDVFSVEELWNVETGEVRDLDTYRSKIEIDFDINTQSSSFYVHRFSFYDGEDINSFKQFSQEKLESKEYIADIVFLERGASFWEEVGTLVKLTEKISKLIKENLDSFVEIELDPDDVAFELANQYKVGPGFIKFVRLYKDGNNSIKMIFQDQYHYYYVHAEKKTLNKYTTNEICQISKEDQENLRRYDIF